ncbi:MAG: efflux RND transporter periplasmic adaptor subunit [Desulfonatronovibrio sp.]
MFDYLLKFIAAFILLVAAGCQEAETPEKTVRPVQTMTIPESRTTETRIFPGKISPAHEVNLSFRVSNKLAEFPVSEGEYVKAGDIIALLDSRDFIIAQRNISGRLEEARANLQAMLAGARTEDIQSIEARLTAARAALKEADLQYERYRKLHKKDVIAKAVLDNARSKKEEAQGEVRALEMELQKATTGARQEDIQAMRARIDSLEASLDEARSAREDSVLKAPFDGYVARKHVDNHQNITAGMPIVTLQDTSRLEITAGLPEQLMVRKDMIRSIHVRLETFPDFFLPARIKELATDADPATMSYPLTAIMDRPHGVTVFPSMAADVYIAFGTDEKHASVIVPETAIISRDGQKSTVWIYNPETEQVTSRQVRIGHLSSKGVQVVQGLEPGETIIRAGAEFLEEGQKVRVINESMAL